MGLLRIVRRLVLSALLSGLLIAFSASALFVTSWPEWLSLLLEPFSLLLTPGVILSLLFSHTHDYMKDPVLKGAFAFYFVVLYALLWAWSYRAARRKQLLRQT